MLTSGAALKVLNLDGTLVDDGLLEGLGATPNLETLSVARSRCSGGLVRVGGR